MMLRRQVLRLAPAAAMIPAAGRSASAGKPRILYFTRSAGFEHSVVARKGSEPSHSERVMAELAERDGFEVECTKDGRVFDGDLDKYAAIAFYTSGDLTGPAKDGSAPVSAAGKRRLLEAVAAGKGFVGFHSATDTFHSKGPRAQNQREVDPYIAMIGGEFVTHGEQQEASLHAVSQFFYKNIGVPSEGLSFTEEWYAGKNYAKDLHVILKQETKYMKGEAYRRPDFPQTWVRMHGAGRVFYTSLGHREDVWTNPLFQAVAQGGIAWVLRKFDFDIAPNLDATAPGANVLKG
jgi:type 1 glutamine amidotransferase